MKYIRLTLLAAAFAAFATAGLGAAAASTATIRNLNAAYQGEANANHRYSRFAEIADKEGYPQAAKLFRAAARAEAIHRDTHRATIEKLGGTVDALQIEPVKEGTTPENLKAAIAGESYERDSMYPEFVSTALSETARDAVRSFRMALAAEKEHAQLYQEMLDNLSSAPVRDYYVCTVCGFTTPTLPGARCPSCRNPLDKFVKVD